MERKEMVAMSSALVLRGASSCCMIYMDIRVTRNMRLALAVCIFFVVYLSSVSCIFHVLLGGTLLRRRVRYRSEVTNYVDQFGDMPHIRDAIKAAGLGTSVAVFRTSLNETLAVLLSDVDQKLLVAVGAQVLKTLHPHLHILLTGFSGDCRNILRYAKQIVSNHTIEYGAAPSGRYLSIKIGELVAKHTNVGIGRALAVQLFLIHTPVNETSSIYSIDSFGLVHSVSAGVAGRGHKAAYEVLAKYYEDRIEGKEGGYINSTDVHQCIQEMWASQIHAERWEDRKVARIFRLQERAHLFQPAQPSFNTSHSSASTDKDANSRWENTRVHGEENGDSDSSASNGDSEVSVNDGSDSE